MSPSTEAASMRLLRIFPPLFVSPHTELHYPSGHSQKHNRDAHPSEDKIFPSLIGIHPNVISMLVYDTSRLVLHNRHDNRCNEQSEESDARETPVSE